MLCPMGGAQGGVQGPCRSVSIDRSSIRAPRSFQYSRCYHGLEDARAVVWRGQLWLIGTINEQGQSGCE